MTARFSGKVVLVAGGTGGLGRAVSLAFLQEGASVAVTFRAQEEFVALKEAAGEDAPGLTGHNVDVTDSDAVMRMVETILAKQQRIDVLVNTVGGIQGRHEVLGAGLESSRSDAFFESPLRVGAGTGGRAGDVETRSGS